MSSISRKPAGAAGSAGGQFTSTGRADSSVDLDGVAMDAKTREEVRFTNQLMDVLHKIGMKALGGEPHVVVDVMRAVQETGGINATGRPAPGQIRAHLSVDSGIQYADELPQWPAGVADPSCTIRRIEGRWAVDVRIAGEALTVWSDSNGEKDLVWLSGSATGEATSAHQEAIEAWVFTAHDRLEGAISDLEYAVVEQAGARIIDLATGKAPLREG